MSEKQDNPQDHQHTDYAAGTYFGILGTLLALLTFVLLFLQMISEPDIAGVNQRIDELECRIADDETACLRDVLEETR